MAGFVDARRRLFHPGRWSGWWVLECRMRLSLAAAWALSQILGIELVSHPSVRRRCLPFSSTPRRWTDRAQIKALVELLRSPPATFAPVFGRFHH